MNSKAPLFLIEFLIMLLVFSVSCAICLKVFSKAELISLENELRDDAIIETQNIAEKIKGTDSFEHLGAAFDGEKWVIDKGNYHILITKKESSHPLLCIAEIEAADKNGTELFSFEVSYQKEAV
ncbi:MAG: hypothetical protein E7598_03670 [Ruminococcaceae bacterium]|nr:hypothetical protein [Oscillospiraceae bacterium]